MTLRHSSVAAEAPIGLPNVFLHSADMETCLDPSRFDWALCLHPLHVSSPAAFDPRMVDPGSNVLLPNLIVHIAAQNHRCSVTDPLGRLSAIPVDAPVGQRLKACSTSLSLTLRPPASLPIRV